MTDLKDCIADLKVLLAETGPRRGPSGDWLRAEADRMAQAYAAHAAARRENHDWVEKHRADFRETMSQLETLLQRKTAAASAAEPTPKGNRNPRLVPPDGHLTAAEAAAKLGCSVKTLMGHVRSGALHYFIIGHGRKRPRKMFTNTDIADFTALQTRKDSPAPCPSSRTNARRSSGTTFKSEVIAFSARPNARPSATLKK